MTYSRAHPTTVEAVQIRGSSLDVTCLHQTLQQHHVVLGSCPEKLSISMECGWASEFTQGNSNSKLLSWFFLLWYWVSAFVVLDPGSLLEMPNLRSHPKPDSESILTSSPDGWHLKFEKLLEWNYLIIVEYNWTQRKNTRWLLKRLWESSLTWVVHVELLLVLFHPQLCWQGRVSVGKVTGNSEHRSYLIIGFCREVKCRESRAFKKLPKKLNSESLCMRSFF